MKKIIFIFLIVLIINACNKDDQIKNKIIGTWTIDKFYIDNVDSTDEYFSKLGCQIEFLEDIYNGDAYYLNLINCNNNKIYNGFWCLAHDNNWIVIDFFKDSTFINHIGPFGEDRDGTWTIVNLTSNEAKLTADCWYDNWGIGSRNFILEMTKQ